MKERMCETGGKPTGGRGSLCAKRTGPEKQKRRTKGCRRGLLSGATWTVSQGDESLGAGRCQSGNDGKKGRGRGSRSNAKGWQIEKKLREDGAAEFHPTVGGGRRKGGGKKRLKDLRNTS